MNNRDILQIFSPLVLFVIHVIYLILLSKEPLFNKWIDGSFSFFIALVLCNIIRARVLAKAQLNSQAHDSGHDEDGPQINSAP
jgi:hypothetical protein